MTQDKPVRWWYNVSAYRDGRLAGSHINSKGSANLAVQEMVEAVQYFRDECNGLDVHWILFYICPTCDGHGCEQCNHTGQIVTKQDE